MNYKKWLVGGVTLFVFFILIMGSLRAYEKYYLTPERIIKKAWANFSEQPSVEYTGEWKMNGFAVRFSGARETSEGAEEKSWTRLHMKMGATVSMNLELRLIEGSLYIRPGAVTNTFAGITTPAKEWIKIDLASIEERFKQETGDESLPEWYPELFVQETPEEKKAKQGIVKETHLFETIEELKGAKVNGVETYHYGFTLDRDQIKELFIAFAEIRGKNPTEEEVEELEKELDLFGALSGEVWIGKKERLPYKIVIKGEDQELNMYGDTVLVDPADMTPERVATSGKKVEKPLMVPGPKFTITFKKFGQPIKVVAPKYKEDSKEIEDLILSMLSRKRDEARVQAEWEASREAAREAGEETAEALKQKDLGGDDGGDGFVDFAEELETQ